MSAATTRIIAFFLLLAFAQRLGMQAFMHNKLHAAKYETSSNPYQQTIRTQCDCMDDALMPFAQPQISEIKEPAPGIVVSLNEYQVYYSSHNKLYCSLKAPPAI